MSTRDEIPELESALAWRLSGADLEARQLVETGAWIFLLEDGERNAHYSMVEF